MLQQHGLSKMIGSASLVDEKRSFNAEFAGGIWYGDVMHGPHVPVKGRLRKTYLVSLIARGLLHRFGHFAHLIAQQQRHSAYPIAVSTRAPDGAARNAEGPRLQADAMRRHRWVQLARDSRCSADDRQAPEQLCRYITHPALINERVQTKAAEAALSTYGDWGT